MVSAATSTLQLGHEQGNSKNYTSRNGLGDFSGGPVARTVHSQCREPGRSPGQGARLHMPQQKTPQATAVDEGERRLEKLA